MPDPLLDRLPPSLSASVVPDQPLSELCAFHLGGTARYYCAPSSFDGLRDLWLAAKAADLPAFVLGGGTNVLFADEGFPGLVISTRGLHRIEASDPARLRVQAGCTNAQLTETALQRGWTGFEWASGLPGTVGGGVFMNARCYGNAFEQNVVEVTALRPDGSRLTVGAADCDFGYKDSIFQKNDWTILEVVLKLAPGEPGWIAARSREIIEDRRRKGQFLFPSAGCIFKNDHRVGVPAGRLIEECGLKGYRIGGAKIFERHANFIVNTGTATAQEVRALAEHVQRVVWERRGVRLETEVRLVP